MDSKEIQEKLPHREPFLWVDSVIELKEDSIVAEKFIAPELDIFRGHYPDYPILPGVIILEALFQAGALLIAEKVGAENVKGVPVVTRVSNARFKRQVRPGDKLTLTAKYIEDVSGAYFMKGKALVDGKAAATVEFACMLTEKA